MENILGNIARLFTGDPSTLQAQSTAQPRQYTERDLLRMESAIGRELFGPVPKGHQREFFCLDRRTWIWYEQWIDPQTGRPKELTTRYEVHSNGIIKIQEDRPYQVIEGRELKNLEAAIKIYHQRVMQEIYGRDPSGGAAITPAAA